MYLDAGHDRMEAIEKNSQGQGFGKRMSTKK